MLMTRRGFVGAALMVPALPALAAEPPVFSRRGLAIRGYDPVAYFDEAKPVKGKRSIEAEWNGATWRFASTGNRDRFNADPQAYAPQYGGYCAWAVSNNYTASTDPDAWTIHDGRLYLNYSLGVQRTWSQDVPGNIARGDANWPGVLN